MKNYLQTPGEPRDDSKYVIYTVKMPSVGTSNRPDMYELMVKFMRDPALLEFDIEAGIKNPLPGEKVSFSFCRKCKNENSNPECDKCGLNIPNPEKTLLAPVYHGCSDLGR